MIKKTKIIAKVMGDYLVIKEYEEPVFFGFNNTRKNNYNKGISSSNKENSQKRSLRRAKDNIVSLIPSNFTNKDKFITLTFQEEITDANLAVKALKEFIKQLKKGFSGLKYLTTMEIGEENGKLHFHMVANLEFIEKHKLDELWGYGDVYIKNVNEAEGGIFNLATYMAKQYKYDTTHPLVQLTGKRKYWCNHKLTKCSTYREIEEITSLNIYNNYHLIKSEYQDETYKGIISQKVLRAKKPKLKPTPAETKVNRRRQNKNETVILVRNAIIDLNTRSARTIAKHIGRSPSYVQKIINDFIN